MTFNFLSCGLYFLVAKFHFIISEKSTNILYLKAFYKWLALLEPVMIALLHASNLIMSTWNHTSNLNLYLVHSCSSRTKTGVDSISDRASI